MIQGSPWVCLQHRRLNEWNTTTKRARTFFLTQIRFINPGWRGRHASARQMAAEEQNGSYGSKPQNNININLQHMKNSPRGCGSASRKLHAAAPQQPISWVQSPDEEFILVCVWQTQTCVSTVELVGENKGNVDLRSHWKIKVPVITAQSSRMQRWLDVRSLDISIHSWFVIIRMCSCYSRVGVSPQPSICLLMHCGSLESRQSIVFIVCSSKGCAFSKKVFKMYPELDKWLIPPQLSSKYHIFWTHASNMAPEHHTSTTMFLCRNCFSPVCPKSSTLVWQHKFSTWTRDTKNTFAPQ